MFSDELGKTIDSLVDFDDTSYEAMERKVSAFEVVKNEIMNVEVNKELEFEDKEFIEENLKSVIEIGTTVLQVGAANVRPGSHATHIQGFAAMMSSMISALKELRDFKKMIHDMKIMANPQLLEPPKPTIQNNIMVNDLSSLTKLLKEAKAKSKLGEIEAKFEVEEGKVFEVK
jgi:hypothetical protein